MACLKYHLHPKIKVKMMDRKITGSTDLLDRYLLALIVILAVFFRLHGIERQSLWIDELYAISLSFKPHFHDIFFYLLEDSHPPGYVSFMYFYTKAFYQSELMIRMHSLLAGVGLVYVTYLVAVRNFSSTAGLFAAALVCVSYRAIYYSQEARAYSMLAVACLISLHYILVLIHEGKLTKKQGLCFWISSTLVLYLHYSGFVFFACEMIILFIAWSVSKNRISFLVEGIKAISIPIITYLPWLPVMYGHMTTIDSWSDAYPAPDINTLIHLAYFLIGPEKNVLYGYLAFITICIFYVLYKAMKRNDDDDDNPNKTFALMAIFFMAIAPIAVFYIKSQFSQRVFQDRHFIYSIPLFALMAGFGISVLLSKIPHGYFANTLKSSSIFFLIGYIMWLHNQSSLYTEYTKDPIRESVDVVLADKEFLSQKNRIVLKTHGAMYYYLFKAGWTDAVNDTYTTEHYSEIEMTLKESGSFYFLNMGGRPDIFSFYTRAHEDFLVECQRELISWTGSIFVTKFSKHGTKKESDNPPLCAPDLHFNFHNPSFY